MTTWINLAAIAKIIFFGLLVGAGLPTLFAIGVRMNALGVAGHDGTASQKNPVLVALSWVLFTLVVTAVLIGVLFVARDFIAHHSGLYLLGAKHK